MKVAIVRSVLRRWLRPLRSTPALSAAVVAVLALGLAIAIAGFMLVDAVLFKPLGITDADAVYRFGGTGKDRKYLNSSSYPAWQAYRQSTPAFTDVAAEAWAGSLHWQRGPGDVRRLEGRLVSGNYFDVLGVQAQQGRLLAERDDRVGADPVVVISDALWRHALDARSDVLEQRLTIGQTAFQIVGVAPPEFDGMDLAPMQVWLPLAPNLTPSIAFTSWNYQMLELFGRLKADATLEQAQAQLDAQTALNGAQNDSDRIAVLDPVVPARARLRDEEPRRAAGLLGMSVALLLLIATANAAGLLLVRIERRRAELAMRLALGATRARIASQLFAETAGFVLVSALLGLLLALLLVRLAIDLGGAAQVLGLSAGDLPSLLRSGAVAALLVLVVSLLVGLLPAARLGARQLPHQLRGAGGSSESRGTRWRSGRWLLVGQLGLTLLLLIGAGVLTQTLQRKLERPRGYQAMDTLAMRLDLGDTFVRDRTNDARAADMLARLRAAPAVRAAAIGWAPVSRSSMTSTYDVPQRSDGSDKPAFALLDYTSDNLLASLGVRLLAGRELVAADLLEGAPPVGLVSRSMAARYWPGQSAVGRHLKPRTEDGDPLPEITVVGVVEDIDYRPTDQQREDVLHVPYTQRGFGGPGDLLVRPQPGMASEAAAAMRAAVAAVTPDRAAGGIDSMQQRLDTHTAGGRFLALATSVFAALGLLLAACGLYGMFSFLVAVRQRELGLRLALGARPRQVFALMLGDSNRLLLAGLALGAVLSGYGVRLLTAQLPDVQPPGVALAGSVALLLCLTCWLAVTGPARRAARTAPITSLRSD